MNVGAEQVLRVGARLVPTGIHEQPVACVLEPPLAVRARASVEKQLARATVSARAEGV